MSWFLGPMGFAQHGPLPERQKFGVSRDERGYSDVPNPLAGKHYPFSGDPEPKREDSGVVYPGLAGACVHNSDVKLKVSVKGASQGIADSVLDSMRGYPGLGSALQRDFAEDAEEERERALASVENSYPGIHNQEDKAEDAPKNAPNDPSKKSHAEAKLVKGLNRGIPLNPATGRKVTIFKKTEKGVSHPQFENVAPPGMEHVVKGLKKAKDVDNPYAVAWWLYDKKK